MIKKSSASLDFFYLIISVCRVDCGAARNHDGAAQSRLIRDEGCAYHQTVVDYLTVAQNALQSRLGRAGDRVPHHKAVPTEQRRCPGLGVDRAARQTTVHSAACGWSSAADGPHGSLCHSLA